MKALILLLVVSVVMGGCALTRSVESSELEFKKDENGDRRGYVKGETDPYSGMSFSMSAERLRAKGQMKNGLPVWDKMWDTSNGKLYSHTKYYPNSVDIQTKEQIVWWTRQGGHKEKHKKWNEKGELTFRKEWDSAGEQRSIPGWRIDGTIAD